MPRQALNEVVRNIGGKRMYIWRAVDDEGDVLNRSQTLRHCLRYASFGGGHSLQLVCRLEQQFTTTRQDLQLSRLEGCVRAFLKSFSTQTSSLTPC